MNEADLTPKQRRWLQEEREKAERQHFLREYRSATASCAVLIVPQGWDPDEGHPADVQLVAPQGTA